MSLFDDILESDKVKTFFKDNSAFQPIYNKLKGNDKKKLSREEQLDEDYKFSNIAKKESALMSQSDKKQIINKITNYIDSYPVDTTKPDSRSNTRHKFIELEFFSSNSMWGKDKDNYVFNKINRTQTLIGKSLLQELIMNPIDDITILNERKKTLHIIENFTNQITKEQSNITDE